MEGPGLDLAWPGGDTRPVKPTGASGTRKRGTQRPPTPAPGQLGWSPSPDLHFCRPQCAGTRQISDQAADRVMDVCDRDTDCCPQTEGAS